MSWLQSKKVVVTGGAGFLGSHLCEKLLSLGAEVLAVDSLLTGGVDNIEHLKNNTRFSFIQADVTQSPETYFPKNFVPDAILHFASPASPPWYQKYPIETYLVNSYGTHLLLEYLRSTAPQARFLFAGTSEAYGDPQVHPQVESYWGNVNPNGPRSCYDESKRLGESICGVHARDFGMDVRIVRIFNTYGPRMDIRDGRVIPNLISQALSGEKMSIYGDGSQTRSYCFVDDLVAGILSFLSGPDSLSGETINLGNPDEYTILQTAQVINQVLGRTESELVIEFKELPKDDPTRRLPDTTKALLLLGWSAQVPFEEGLKKTIEYFRTQR